MEHGFSQLLDELKRHGQFWFSLIFFHYFHYPPDLIRFVAFSCHRILWYPACPLRILLLIALRVLSRYGLTLKLALRNVSVRWVCATSVPLGCQGMSGGHWKSDKRSINQVWIHILKHIKTCNLYVLKYIVWTSLKDINGWLLHVYQVHLQINSAASPLAQCYEVDSTTSLGFCVVRGHRMVQHIVPSSQVMSNLIVPIRLREQHIGTCRSW